MSWQRPWAVKAEASVSLHMQWLLFLHKLFVKILIYRNLQNRKYVLEPGIIFTWIGNQKGEQKGKDPFVKGATENSFSDPNLSFCSSVTPWKKKRFHIYIWLKSHLMYCSFKKLPVGLTCSPQKCGLYHIHMIFRCRWIGEIFSIFRSWFMWGALWAAVLFVYVSCRWGLLKSWILPLRFTVKVTVGLDSVWISFFFCVSYE